MITFASPLWLMAGGFIIVLLIFLYKEIHRRRTKELQRFAASHLLGKLCGNVSPNRRILKKILILAAISCCFVALARPQYGFKWIDVKRKGIDILFAVDTSKSMLAEDVHPNRLKRAKFAIMDFVGQLEGDRVGLMPFAGSAFLMCPMTIDYSAFESSLGAVDTTIIPRGGTDLAVAITEAESILSNEANHKILVLITDGENLEGNALQAAETAAEKGMTVYTVGVGTSEGELIPLNRNGKTGFVKGETGKFITSQLDETVLTKIAEATDGLYVPLGASGEGLQTIYQEKLSLIPKEELAEKRHKVPLDRFVWPLGAAIVLLILEFMMGGRKSSHSLRIPFIKTAGRREKQKTAVAPLLLLLVFFSGIHEVQASKGEEAYGEGDFITASEFYDEQLQHSPDDARLHYNYGTAAYKNNMYEDAAKAFSEALKSEDLGLQEEAYYNRGNALFQLGQETLQTDPKHTINMWEQAVSSLDGSLQLNSMNDDASFNLEIVKKKLEELKKQQEQQEQEEKDQQDQEQNNEEKKEENKEQNGDQGQEENPDQNPQNEKQDSSGQQEEQQEGKEEQQGQENGQESETEKPQQEDESTGDESKDASEDGGQEAAEERAKQQEQQAQARDQERRLQGKMTREEARQLLNSLKDEEGELNFVPSARTDRARDQEPAKDW